MQHTHKNATVQPSSTGPSKFSRIGLKAETLRLFFIAKAILEYKRRSRHTDAEVFDAVFTTVYSAIPELVSIVASASKVSGERIGTIKVRRKTLESIKATSRKERLSLYSYVHACLSIFTRAAAASAGQLVLSEEFSDLKAELYKANSSWDVMLKSLRPVAIRSRKINAKKEVQEMRYHNYLEIFHDHMQQYGGIDKFLNSVIVLPIHCLPIEGAPGKDTPDDAPIEVNPGAVYVGKIWKRGRGYNITILTRVGGVEPGPAAATHPTRRETITRPEIPIGSVIRLYDLFRNIDWRAVRLNQE